MIKYNRITIVRLQKRILCLLYILILHLITFFLLCFPAAR